MELSGAIASLERLSREARRVAIYTDSSYVIKGITQWIWAWQRRGWKTIEGADVLNRDLWEELSRLVTARGKGRLEWHWVRGHDGTPGNERVDQIAVAFSLQRAETLYDGPVAGYGLPVLDLPDDTTPPSRSSGAAGNRAKVAAHSYLSVVDGVPMRHATWAECEGRVKGRSGARFKKAASAADEAAILRAWGIDRGQL
jgi:ribonuclease HI